MSEREDGFYWVRRVGEEDWFVAYWGEDPQAPGSGIIGWWSYGWDWQLHGDELVEIDERRIVRDEPEGAE